MQVFDDVVIDDCYVFVLCFGFGEGVDLMVCQFGFGFGWGKDGICYGKLGGMDQCFVVKVYIVVLFIFGVQFVFIFEGVEYVVDDDKFMYFGGQNVYVQIGYQWQMVGLEVCVQFFGQIVCVYDYGL